MKKTTIERFDDKIEKNQDGCWLWKSVKNNDGYPIFSVNNKKICAHRFSYELHKCKIEKNKQIDHLCKNRQCVNPDHLEAVSQYENNMRSNSFCAINKRKTHCKNGHEFTDENTIFINKKSQEVPSRSCRECARKRRRDWYKNHINTAV